MDSIPMRCGQSSQARPPTKMARARAGLSSAQRKVFKRSVSAKRRRQDRGL